MTTSLYVDTSVVVALGDNDDFFHKPSLKFMEGLRDRSILCSIGPPFLLEIAKSAEHRGTRAALRLLDTVERYQIAVARNLDDEMWELADAYASDSSIGGVRFLDYMHCASATLLRCTHLASWDRRHFNKRFEYFVCAVNRSRHLADLIVGDPRTIGRTLGIE